MKGTARGCGGAGLLAPERGGGAVIDHRLVAAVMLGFVGVAKVLRPTIQQEHLWHGVVGLGSGLIAATAYLQVTALGRIGEPGERVVGILLFDERPTWMSAAGIAFIIAAGVAATLLRQRPRADVAAPTES